jgi:hypothetical protein
MHRPPRRWVVEAADALGLEAADRDELLAAFGHAPAEADRPPAEAARRHVEEAARLLGASPAQVAAALAALGIPAAD